ncbi:hypothetical protein EDB89DRAFT_1947479 [Lactarius sanguifluus]|nr:hypothetical protein EDB89DRAFT_1947479 [Lactarius sanguifluus]
MSNSPTSNWLDNEQIQRLLDQGTSQQQLMNMLQQQQQNAARSNQSFPAGFNHLPASPNPGGPTSGSFLGGGLHQQQSPSPAPGHDPLSAMSPQGRMSLQAQSLGHQQPGSNQQPANFSPSSSDPFMSSAGQLPIRQSQQQLNPQHKNKQRQFLGTLANFHLACKDPLPPALTGIPYPLGFDPNQSKWKTLESSQTEAGSVMLAGKPVDLFKLWAAVHSGGGWAKLSQERLWPSMLQVFDLPETFSVNGAPTSVAQVLGQYYRAILLPFEEWSRKNAQQQRPMVNAQGQVGQPQQVGQHGMTGQMSGADINAQGAIPPAIPHVDGNSSLPPHHPLPSSQVQRQPTVGLDILPPTGSSLQSPGMVSGMGPSISQPFLTQASSPDSAQLHGQTQEGRLSFDSDAENRKRKGAPETGDMKRARQRTVDSPDTNLSTADRASAPPTGESSTTAATSTSQQNQPSDAPHRRKVEYLPLVREVDTVGGRDLRAITEEHQRLTSRHPLREISEWGNIDIDALTMSLRSRISTEMGYAITTFTLLSIMRGQGTSGFPIANCPELMDEVLDLLLEVSFKEEEQDDAFAETSIITNKQLVDTILENGNQPFAGLEKVQGMKDYATLGPKQRPGDVVLAIVNIMRNLSVIPDNHEYLANHERLLAAMLRVCGVKLDPDGKPRAASSALTLRDLVAVRRDVLYLLINLSGSVRLAPSMVLASTPSPAALQVARRAFMLTASFLVDPSETINPSELFILTSTNSNSKPPALVDAALEVLGRFGQPDANRQVIAKAVPQIWLRQIFEALLHRLPVVDDDFKIAKREPWLSYIEKVIMGLYAIAFLAPPSMKEQLKKDHRLGFTKLMLRLVKKFTMNVPQELRMWFSVCAKRAVETLKVVDEGEDAFDTTPNTGSVTLSFGVGYGEVGEDYVEKGTGSLSGFQEEVVWGIMLQKEVDDSMFRELESLARVG